MEQIKTTKPLYKACAKLRTCLAMIAAGMFFGTQQAASQPANAIPVDLRCNYQTTPLCIASAPNLSWKTQTKEKGWLQSAYRILVATSQEKLNKGPMFGTVERRKVEHQFPSSIKDRNYNPAGPIGGKCAYGTTKDAFLNGQNQRSLKHPCSLQPTGAQHGSGIPML